MLRRTFHHLSKETFIPLYKSLVRTHLDFASPVWSPYKIKQIEKIEGVQRRATKQLPGHQDLSYPERIKALKLPTLSYRRIRGDMIELYKILSGVYDPETSTFIQLWKDIAPRTGLRGHSKKIYPKKSKIELEAKLICTESKLRHGTTFRHILWMPQVQTVSRTDLTNIGKMRT